MGSSRPWIDTATNLIDQSREAQQPVWIDQAVRDVLHPACGLREAELADIVRELVIEQRWALVDAREDYAGAPGSVDLGQQKGKAGAAAFSPMVGWKRISTAPFDCDLQLAVVRGRRVHSLVFPCRRILGGWMDAETKKKVEVYPTHWREWKREA